LHADGAMQPRLEHGIYRFAVAALAAIAGAVVVSCRPTRGGSAGTTFRTSARRACADTRLGRGFELLVLGSGGPRSAGCAASSCLFTVGGTPRIVVDVGAGFRVAEVVRKQESGWSYLRTGT
jgi:hypothetical protein